MDRELEWEELQVARIVAEYAGERAVGARVGGLRAERAVRSHTAEIRRSEEHTSELQSRSDLVCRLLLEKKNAADLNAGHDELEGSCSAHRRAEPSRAH